ncbi:uncharacterized protein LOC118194942 [Stegodyphus dumicola]|uniref:uncharacterized protein LOC118194942 n=1 Tax=Stegodyphus dumicola TaxID=202533 RepID=UPI0015AE63D7|nr:uncharacterized protein LOC118194942 [Stegodyphus dumicola]
MAHNNPKWTEILPIVLLGIRSAIKKDINATCAELLYGTTLRLPSDMLNATNIVSPTESYVSQLRSVMHLVRLIPTSRHIQSPIYVHPAFQTCSHVFLRFDSVKPPLTPPYTGPHTVVKRMDKNFEVNNKNITVTIDCLKPEYMLLECINSPVIPQFPQEVCEDSNIVPKQVVTRSGRRVHFPKT